MIHCFKTSFEVEKEYPIYETIVNVYVPLIPLPGSILSREAV